MLLPQGYEIGERLPNIVVKSCNGQDFSLDELCGAKGLWILAAQQEAFHDQYEANGLTSVTVIVQTEPPARSGGTPALKARRCAPKARHPRSRASKSRVRDRRERDTGFEPATPSLGSSCSTN